MLFFCPIILAHSTTMSLLWLLISHYIIIIRCRSQNIVTFEQSVQNPDEYCTNENDCQDIQFILDNNCTNTTQQSECKFILNNDTFVQNHYVISSQISQTIITFATLDDEPMTVDLMTSFLLISAYTGIINIQNIHFTSSSSNNQQPFINISAENTQLDININKCHFYDMPNTNGSIVNIPSLQNNDDFSHRISITFTYVIMFINKMTIS